MTLPRNYDRWRLQGPEEQDDMTDEEREAAEEYETERGEWMMQKRKDDEE